MILKLSKSYLYQWLCLVLPMWRLINKQLSYVYFIFGLQNSYARLENHSDYHFCLKSA
jgi:hypothetical protein